jgi:FkbM family methyltransferase
MPYPTAPIGPYRMSVGEPYDAYLPGCFLMNGSNYELHVVNKLREVLKPGDTLLDLGANWGYYTLIANWLTEGNVRVVSVEPNPWNVEILCRNLRINNIKNAQVASVGASDRFRCLNYGISFDNHLGQVVEGPGEPVLLAPMDTLLPDLCPDVIKMDIDGSEFVALDGMTRVLSRAKVLLVEFSAEAILAHGHTPAEFWAKLWTLGFKRCTQLNDGIPMAPGDAPAGVPNVDMCFER